MGGSQFQVSKNGLVNPLPEQGDFNQTLSLITKGFRERAARRRQVDERIRRLEIAAQIREDLHRDEEKFVAQIDRRLEELSSSNRLKFGAGIL